jgi:inosine-uridine nucleoside N-ribohydrolase
MRVVLDCDTGTDDAIAIMLAALHPSLELLGVSTVFGNHPVDETTANTQAVVDLVGADVPVVRGLGGPGPGEAPAVEWLVSTLRPGGVTLVATGPLTNVAAAVTADRSLASCVDEVVVMGGTRSIRTSVTPYAERNIWNDPEAADVVLRAGFPRLTLVTLDATYQALMGPAEVDALRALGTPAGSAAASYVEQRIADYADLPSLGGRAPVHDPLCVAHLLDPSVVDLVDAAVTVELADRERRGQSVIDESGPPNARVALGCDRDRFLQTVLAALG